MEKIELPVSLPAWIYLEAGNEVTSSLAEIVFWSLVTKDVLALSVEQSPVKSEGGVLYVRKGSAFDIPLSSLEEAFKVPFQTKVAERLKWKNYIPQVLRFLKNTEEVEKKYILPELKEKGFFKPHLLDRLIGRKRIIFPSDESRIVFEGGITTALKQKAFYEAHLAEVQWNII